MAELANRFGRGGYSKERYSADTVGTNNDFTAQKSLEIHQVRIHLDEAADAASLLNISVLDNEGSFYHTLITAATADNIDLNGLTDAMYNPTSPIILLKDDVFRVSYANAGAARTYGITVVYKELK